MIPGQLHQFFFDWDQSRKEQGNWPTKTTVKMWFKDETNLALLIKLVKVEKEEPQKVLYKIRAQGDTARL